MQCHLDKENMAVNSLQRGKTTDASRVKRNLINPLKPRNVLANFSSPAAGGLPLCGRNCSNSPVTDLAHDFTELAAHEITPKRRLSLTNSAGSPTPTYTSKPVVKQEDLTQTPSTSCGANTSEIDGSRPCNLIQKFKPVFGSRKNRFSHNNAFRRFYSMPTSESNEASPIFSGTSLRPVSASNSVRTGFYLGDECSRDSLDSGLGKEDGFQFAPGDRHSNRFPKLFPTSRFSGLGDSHGLGDSRSSQAIIDRDDPLIEHHLCCDDVDDGFMDLDHLEKQVCSEIPDSIAPMLTGRLTVGQSQHVKLSVAQSFPEIDSSFDIRRRVSRGKRVEPPQTNSPVGSNKRRKGALSDGNIPPSSSTNQNITPSTLARLQRCKSMVEHSTADEFTKSESDGDLVGDFSKRCCLPLVQGKHSDLKSISAETMANVLRKEYDHVIEEYSIIDCRYPYEFQGGHIQGAENIYTKQDLHDRYLASCSQPAGTCSNKRRILIFHCEFSSERAPRLSRFLRNHDRDVNKDCYPSLYYPEIYLLEGGYKAFFESQKNLCEPQAYRPMAHKDYSEDLRLCRAKSKSLACSSKRGLRTGLRL